MRVTYHYLFISFDYGILGIYFQTIQNQLVTSIFLQN